MLLKENYGKVLRDLLALPGFELLKGKNYMQDGFVVPEIVEADTRPRIKDAWEKDKFVREFLKKNSTAIFSKSPRPYI